MMCLHRPSIVLFVSAALAVAGDTRAAHSTIYQNDEFGFSAEVPAGASICKSEPPENDHGIDIFLDAGPDGCDSLDTRPYVGAGAFYNAPQYPSPEDALSNICSLRGATRESAPSGLAIAGLRSASCRANSADKSWIDIYVEAQNGDLGKNAGVNYGASLHTTPLRLDADLARFRVFLKSIKIERVLDQQAH